MDYSKLATESFAIIIPSLISIKDGVFKSIGNDIWKLIKKAFKFSEKDIRIIEDLKNSPNDIKLQGKAELRLAQLLEEKSDIAEELKKCIQVYKEKNQRDGIDSIKNSKNIVIAKDIDIKSKNFIIGDNNQYEK